jgi:CBS domain containing-hemolysin-like protein
MDDPVRVISTVQVGITPIGILTGAVGEPLVRDLLGEGLPAGVGFVAAFVIVTYLSVVLGELVPKALTLERSEALATLVAPAVESSRSLAGSGRSPGSHSTRSAAAPARRRRRGRRRGDPRQGRRRPADHPTRDRAVTQPLSRCRR